MHSLGAWLQRLSQMPARSGAQPLPRVLPAHEEWILWRKAAAGILEQEASLADSAFTADSLADSLQSAAELMAHWRIPDTALAGRGTEAGWLQAALRKVRAEAAALGAMPRADLPAALCAIVGHPGGAASDERVWLAGVTLDRGLAPLARSAWVGKVETIDLGTSCTPTVVASADPAAEWRAAAEWCRLRLERDPAARLLVVIPDLAKRRPRVERVFREALAPSSLRDIGVGRAGDAALAFALEGGRPLAEYPEPEAALQALRVLSRPCLGADLAALLEAPWWSSGTSGARARIAARLRSDLPQRIAPAALAARLRTLAARGGDLAVIEDCARSIELAVQRFVEGRERLPHWAAVFEDALGALGWPGEAVADSSTQQARLQWRAMLEAFVGALRLAPSRDAGRAVELLAAIARREHFAPSSGDVAVLVTSALEAPVARYDGIRVCGLQADRFPAPVQGDPFIPWELQRDAGIPRASPEGQLGAAASALEAWRACTDELVLSWALGEDDAHWMPSPLLAPWHDAAAARAKAAVESARAARLADLARSLPARLRGPADGPSLETWQDDHGLPWPESEPIPGGAGALGDQIDCPFRAYATRRLGAREEEVAEPGVAASDRGRLLHLALKNFWDETVDSAGLAALSGADRARRLEKCIDDAVVELAMEIDGDELRARLLLRERARALSLGLEALELDATRPAFATLLREGPLEATIGGARVAGRIDRADRMLGGDALAVIDYKSGTRKKLKFEGAEMDAVQLWVYAQMLESSGLGAVEAIGNLHLARKGTVYEAIAATPDALPKAKDKGWTTARADAEARIPALARGFLAGEARVAPRRKACEFCDLAGLCRRSELGIAAEDEADADAEASGGAGDA